MKQKTLKMNESESKGEQVSNSNEIRSKNSSSEMSVILDGRWGWVMVAVSFMLQFFVWGIDYPFGIFLGEIMETFETGRSLTSMVASTQMGMILCVGPISADLVDKFGCRKVIFVGTILSVFGLIVSGIAPNFVIFFINAGVISGMGLGMIYLPSVVIITTYFEKRLSLASGVAACGAGVGTFTFAPIMHLLDDRYGWEYTLMGLGLTMLLCLPLGALCRPLSISGSEQSKVQSNVDQFREKMEITESYRENYCKAAMKYCRIIVGSVTMRGKSYLHLLMDAKCSLYMLSNFLTCVGAAVPFVYAVDRAVLLGIERGEASFLISVMGISSIIGKVGLGYLSDRTWINRCYLYNTCLMFCGLSLVLSSFCQDYATQISYCLVFGLTEGAYVGLTAVITIDIIGMDMWVQAYGVQLFFMGIACIIGPPLTGAFHDATGDHDAGFYFAGALIFFSGIMLFFLPNAKQVKHGPKEERSYNQFSRQFVESTLTIQSTVAWQLGVPPQRYNPKLERNNSEIAVTNF